MAGVVIRGPSQPGVFPHGRGVNHVWPYQICHVAQQGNTELAYIQGPGKEGGAERKQRQRVDAELLSQAIIDDGSRLEKATLCDREACDWRES